MPACFQLIDKTTDKPARFADIDDKLCQYLEKPIDPIEYLYNWYNLVGFGLACGKSFDQLREVFADTDLVPVIDFLDEHYTANAWHQVGR
jgi:hypothetical protein